MSSRQNTTPRADISFSCTITSNNLNTAISSQPLINNNNNTANNIEQPQTKRQKIERIRNSSACYSKNVKNTALLTPCSSKLRDISPPPPDIIDTGDVKILCSSLSSSSVHSISVPNSRNNSPTPSPSQSRTNSLTQLLNDHNCSNILASSESYSQNGANTLLAATTSLMYNSHDVRGSSTVRNTTATSSSDEVDQSHNLPDLLTHPSSSTITFRTDASMCSTTVNTAVHNHNHNHNHNISQLDEQSATQDMRKFEESLMHQCLCGVSERMLRKPFQSHYSTDANGQKRVANLSEWPTNKLLQFLSNLQLLFDIYLKQNTKGFICARIMDVCDALIRNDHNLIDEIIVLAGYSNPYVEFLAGRVLASFLVIAKQEMDDDWLKKLVDNLFYFDHFDYLAIQKIHFSLEIIKRIVEWKDVDLHPLEDEITDTQSKLHVSLTPAGNNLPNGSVNLVEDHAYMHFHTQQPTLNTNYFAVHYRSNEDAPPNAPTTDSHANCYSARNHDSTGIFKHYVSDTLMEQSSTECHLITLTDSESFDTTHLKCITIKILENKWPALVKNMSTLIGNHLDIENAENCVLIFLQLWENIISVKANLSIVETLPFYAQLDKFELLLNHNLSCTVYKQMLCLFNEALCYGSTLALQDMLPDETCNLAHQIVRHVKDFRILESLPRLQPENVVGLIGFKRKPLIYSENSFDEHFTGEVNSSDFHVNDTIEMDKTILQKMVLLVLKSIAVTVKEIRSDSSDSSIDSSDYEAFQDMVLIERSIRDVLRKLELFIKHTLEFHPECHFSKILIHLFDDQDDHLIEAMVCTLDVTAGISFRNNAFPELVSMLNPVYTFLEFLKMISNSSDLLLDLLVSNETCFLLYLLRFLKYIRANWSMFVHSCHDFGMGVTLLDEAMSVLIRLRLQISRLVSRQLYPYDISPVLRLLESCESLYEGNELS